MAATLGGCSEHPIVEAAGEAAIEPADVSEFESLTGTGVHADVDGETHFAAEPALFTE